MKKAFYTTLKLNNSEQSGRVISRFINLGRVVVRIGSEKLTTFLFACQTFHNWGGGVAFRLGCKNIDA